MTPDDGETRPMDDLAERFEDYRPRLRAVAYRIVDS
jgi:DNA-directed RNA polymerase specialized sigma24 family protein